VSDEGLFEFHPFTDSVSACSAPASFEYTEGPPEALRKADV